MQNLVALAPMVFEIWCTEVWSGRKKEGYLSWTQIWRFSSSHKIRTKTNFGMRSTAFYSLWPAYSDKLYFESIMAGKYVFLRPKNGNYWPESIAHSLPLAPKFFLEGRRLLSRKQEPIFVYYDSVFVFKM